MLASEESEIPSVILRMLASEESVTPGKRIATAALQPRNDRKYESLTSCHSEDARIRRIRNTPGKRIARNDREEGAVQEDPGWEDPSKQC